MRKFVIGEDYDKIDKAARNVRYEEVKQEIRDKLGIDDGFLPGFAPYEVMELDGTLYYRRMVQSLFSLVPEQHIPKSGTVACSCGGKSFYVSYGNYECHGTCVQCGLIHVLYDG